MEHAGSRQQKSGRRWISFFSSQSAATDRSGQTGGIGKTSGGLNRDSLKVKNPDRMARAREGRW
jgi:hypothetical protein